MSEEEVEASAPPVDTTLPPPVDATLRARVERIPLLTVRAGPRDGDAWLTRLKEELHALIQYVQLNKQNDTDWFTIEPLDKGTRWRGTCWYMHNMHKYEFAFEFEIPAVYPTSPIEIVLPELDGRTVKMYRGGKICLSAHFHPLWARNVPRFGIAHALALGLAPWLAAEVPFLIDQGQIREHNNSNSSSTSSNSSSV